MKNKANNVIQLMILGMVAVSALPAEAARKPRIKAPDAAYLDPPYKKHSHPSKARRSWGDSLPAASNMEQMLAAQTPVKSQGHRGTCSMFSATALLETLLIRFANAPKDLDLSEEWLEYHNVRKTGASGGSSYNNFAMLVKYGTMEEELNPYIGEDWAEDPNQNPLAQERCGDIPQALQLNCLKGHRDPRLYDAPDAELMNPSSALYDPEFQKARARSVEFRKQFLSTAKKPQPAPTVDDVKAALAKGIAVTLDQDFYYGSWAHRQAAALGIGQDTEQFAKGIVSYPEPGSLDAKLSHEDPAGHSILLVGYDDNMVLTYKLKMENGETKTFKRKGVYFFKNSWGTNAFGVLNTYKGKPIPGYGVMTQDYAHDYGTFWTLPLK